MNDQPLPPPGEGGRLGACGAAARAAAGGLGGAVALAGAAWGFAEATLFFIVPDVLLTGIALRHRRLALAGCLAALLGALAGGALMYSWSAIDRPAALAAVDRVPFLPAALIARVEGQLEARGPLAVVLGAWMGRPYKVYAVQAPVTGLSLGGLLAVSVPARLLRFVALVLLASALAGRIVRRWGRRPALAVWALAWSLQYAVYWSLVG